MTQDTRNLLSFLACLFLGVLIGVLINVLLKG